MKTLNDTQNELSMRPATLTRAEWNQRYATREFIWTVNPNHHLTAAVKGLAPGHALDLAAGEGRNAVWLAEQGWTVRAVDFSCVALEKGRQLARGRAVADRIEFQLADLRYHEPEVHSFDLVVLIYLQIPMTELIPILARAAKAVAPGGALLLVAHDLENLKHGFGGPRDPELLYTAEQVVTALGGELQIETACRVARSVDVAGEHPRIALDCLVKAHRPTLT
jgi:SAM-dependent methyltransferase